MAGWSINNEAHRKTWFFLFDMKEITVNFDQAAGLTMKDLAFRRVAGDSSDILRTKAKALATELDNRFRNFAGARYEPTKDQASATNAMVATLMEAAKAMGEFGDVVDDHYHFLGEPDDPSSPAAGGGTNA